MNRTKFVNWEPCPLSVSMREFPFITVRVQCSGRGYLQLQLVVHHIKFYIVITLSWVNVLSSFSWGKRNYLLAEYFKATYLVKPFRTSTLKRIENPSVDHRTVPCDNLIWKQSCLARNLFPRFSSWMVETGRPVFYTRSAREFPSLLKGINFKGQPFLSLKTVAFLIHFFPWERVVFQPRLNLTLNFFMNRVKC